MSEVRKNDNEEMEELNWEKDKKRNDEKREG